MPKEKMFKKKIATNTLNIQEVVINDGVPTLTELAPIIVEGNLTDKQAQMMVNKEYKGRNVFITSIDKTIKTYALPFSTFIEYATLIDDGVNELKEDVK